MQNSSKHIYKYKTELKGNIIMDYTQKPSLLRKPKDKGPSSQISKSEECVTGYDDTVFMEIENKINVEINSLISELEQLRRESLEQLTEQREHYKRKLLEWQQIGLEYSDYLEKNLDIETKRNSLANLQTFHANTISKGLFKHRKTKPRAPFMLLTCRKESILAGIAQSKLRVHPIDHKIVSFTEERIKGWKGKPEYVAIDSDSSNIYFSDPDNRCVRGYSMGGGYIGEVGLWSDEMLTPSSIAILEGNLFVSDLGLNCISKFNLREEGKFKFRSSITLKSPIAIAFNGKEELYVLDQLERKLAVLDTNLEFIRGYNLKIDVTGLPLDIKVSAGRVYVLFEEEIVWFEEPTGDNSISKSLKVTYNYTDIPTGAHSNRHFCIDEEGNIIRTAANGQLVVNAADGSEINRISFDSANETTSNLTGVCVIKKGWFVVAVTNKENIIHIVESH